VPLELNVSDENVSQTNTVSSTSGFEGPEKRLEIYFRPVDDLKTVFELTEGLRTVSRDEWTDILRDAQCSILSAKSNDYFDSYLLSESSLFIFSTKFMIKTCGTTTLLKVIPRVNAVAERLGMEMDYMQYSRASFTFPNQQLHPHTSFQSEVDYLNRFFKGESYVLGTPDGATKWHLYIAGDCRIPTNDQGFEIFMFDLDEGCMSHFFNVDADGTERFGSANGATTSEKSGITRIMSEGSILDAYNFEPCGYSMNGLENSSYYTIHITPEPQCSYVSFECNLPLDDFTGILATVLDVFKPGKFSIALHADITAPAAVYGLKELLAKESPWGYQAEGDSTFLRMKTVTGHAVSATVCSYVAERNLPVSTPVLKSPGLRTPRPLLDFNGGLKEVAMTYRAELARRGTSVEDFVAELITKRTVIEHPISFVDLTAVSDRIDLVLQKMTKHHELRCSVRPSSDPAILRLLDHAGCIFDASSMPELQRLRSAGIDAKHAVLTNPICGLSNVSKAKELFQTMRIFDDMDEPTVRRIGSSFPGTAFELRLMNPLEVSVESVIATAEATIMNAINAGLEPSGISFQLPEESGCKPEEFRRALEIAHRLVAGFLRPECPIPPHKARGIRRLSAGSSFPGASSFSCEEFSSGVRTALDLADEFFPPSSGIAVGLDPGSFLVSSAHSLLLSIVARRDVREGGFATYYVNDGVYGSLAQLKHPAKRISQVADPVCFVGGSKQPCKVIGPSCEDADELWSGELPRLQVGNCLLFPRQGATVDADRSRHSIVYFLAAGDGEPQGPPSMQLQGHGNVVSSIC